VFTKSKDDFYVKVARKVEEACKLVDVGFEYVTGEYEDGGKIFRKRKRFKGFSKNQVSYSSNP
jgi:hypothetical protein